MSNLHANAKDLAGRRFGRLLALEPLPERTNDRQVRWLCLCDCGNRTEAIAGNLRRGKTQSCGCLEAESRVKHGHSGTRIYNTYQHMVQRCHNPNDDAYANYGGRGITVCERWRASFETFLSDVGAAPSNRHTLDRIDNDGHYEPGNVRWATPQKQHRNKRTNHLVTYEGETKCVQEWADILGIKHQTLLARIRHGWPVERRSRSGCDHA